MYGVHYTILPSVESLLSLVAEPSCTKPVSTDILSANNSGANTHEGIKLISIRTGTVRVITLRSRYAGDLHLDRRRAESVTSKSTGIAAASARRVGNDNVRPDASNIFSCVETKQSYFRKGAL